MRVCLLCSVPLRDDLEDIQPSPRAPRCAPKRHAEFWYGPEGKAKSQKKKYQLELRIDGLVGKVKLSLMRSAHGVPDVARTRPAVLLHCCMLCEHLESLLRLLSLFFASNNSSATVCVMHLKFMCIAPMVLRGLTRGQKAAHSSCTAHCSVHGAILLMRAV